MTEFVSRVNQDEYEITFKTSIWSEYKELQEAMRSIIDSHKTTYTHTEISEGYQVCPTCSKEE